MPRECGHPTVHGSYIGGAHGKSQTKEYSGIDSSTVAESLDRDKDRPESRSHLVRAGAVSLSSLTLGLQRSVRAKGRNAFSPLGCDGFSLDKGP
jgi:hypothetical protein